MSDAADIAQENADREAALLAPLLRFDVPTGPSGDCVSCGHGSPRFVDGKCVDCREIDDQRRRSGFRSLNGGF